jgi:hypothetical protein
MFVSWFLEAATPLRAFERGIEVAAVFVKKANSADAKTTPTESAATILCLRFCIRGNSNNPFCFKGPILQSMHGLLALVGSGEYLPVMQRFESEWLLKGESRGKKRKYVQLATAAGKESAARHDFWKSLGAEQAARLGAEHVFVPVFNREDALREEYAELINGAALIYLSGGDPGYLVSTLENTPVWGSIYDNWKAGSSLAGCSAGAMAMHGLGILPQMKINNLNE